MVEIIGSGIGENIIKKEQLARTALFRKLEQDIVSDDPTLQKQATTKMESLSPAQTVFDFL